MAFFSFLDKHPSQAGPTRVHDSDRSMTDWIRDGRQVQHERVDRSMRRVKELGAVVLVASAVVVGAVSGAALFNRGVDRTEAFNQANAGNAPAEVAELRREHALDAAAAAHRQE